MAKNTQNVLIVIAIIAAIVLSLHFLNIGPFSTLATGALTRQVTSTTVNPGQTFTVTYATSGTTSKWFVAWEDAVSGGCTPATYKNFMASEDGSASSVNKVYTAPSSGSCTFTGTYQYSGGSTTSFAPLTINVCVASTCSSLGKQCGSWSNGCGGTLACPSCASGQTCSAAGQCLTCRTAADTDCNNAVTLTELMAYAQKWVSNQITLSDLMGAAGAWVGS